MPGGKAIRVRIAPIATRTGDAPGRRPIPEATCASSTRRGPARRSPGPGVLSGPGRAASATAISATAAGGAPASRAVAVGAPARWTVAVGAALGGAAASWTVSAERTTASGPITPRAAIARAVVTEAAGPRSAASTGTSSTRTAGPGAAGSRAIIAVAASAGTAAPRSIRSRAAGARAVITETTGTGAVVAEAARARAATARTALTGAITAWTAGAGAVVAEAAGAGTAAARAAFTGAITAWTAGAGAVVAKTAGAWAITAWAARAWAASTGTTGARAVAGGAVTNGPGVVAARSAARRALAGPGGLAAGRTRPAPPRATRRAVAIRAAVAGTTRALVLVTCLNPGVADPAHCYGGHWHAGRWTYWAVGPYFQPRCFSGATGPACAAPLGVPDRYSQRDPGQHRWNGPDPGGHPSPGSGLVPRHRYGPGHPGRPDPARLPRSCSTLS